MNSIPDGRQSPARTALLAIAQASNRREPGGLFSRTGRNLATSIPSFFAALAPALPRLSLRPRRRRAARGSHLLLLLILLLHLLQFFLQQHLLLFPGQLGKQQHKLQPQTPRRNSRGVHSVAIELRRDVHRLKSEFHDSSDAATERHRPDVSVVRSPVRSNGTARALDARSPREQR